LSLDEQLIKNISESPVILPAIARLAAATSPEVVSDAGDEQNGDENEIATLARRVLAMLRKD
jgi:hypothetical protein